MHNGKRNAVVIGCEQEQKLAAEVLRSSILQHTDCVDIFLSFELLKGIISVGNTPFSSHRFLSPVWCAEYDKVVYLDSDMLVFRNITELFNAEEEDGVYAVKQPKNGRSDQTSVVLFVGPSKLYGMKEAQKAIEMLSDKKTYKEVMERFNFSKFEVQYTIPSYWNSLEALNSDTRLIHFTDMETQPWLSTANPLSYIWEKEFLKFYSDNVEGVVTAYAISKKKKWIRPSLNNASPTSSFDVFRDFFYYPPGLIGIKRPFLSKIIFSKWRIFSGLICLALRALKALKNKREASVLKQMIKIIITQKMVYGNRGLFSDYY